jgi:hypothetical protein
VHLLDAKLVILLPILKTSLAVPRRKLTPLPNTSHVRLKTSYTSSLASYAVYCMWGETGRMLKERINDHLSAIRLQNETPIGIHFNLPFHSVSNVSIIAIETNLPNKTNRRAREVLWQNILKNPASFWYQQS